uniref:Uncharacterized protein n=1 Tax=Micrurus lemniscatus lemniscatus TaxID=129467 RepID=A0A2D4IXF1_MICLE
MRISCFSCCAALNSALTPSPTSTLPSCLSSSSPPAGLHHLLSLTIEGCSTEAADPLQGLCNECKWPKRQRWGGVGRDRQVLQRRWQRSKEDNRGGRMQGIQKGIDGGKQVGEESTQNLII